MNFWVGLLERLLSKNGWAPCDVTAVLIRDENTHTHTHTQKKDNVNTQGEDDIYMSRREVSEWNELC